MLMCAKQHKLQSTMQSHQTAPQPVFALPFLLQPLLADILPQCHRPLTRMLPGLLRNLQTLGCQPEKTLLVPGGVACGKGTQALATGCC